MASATNNDEKTMATEELPGEASDARENQPLNYRSPGKEASASGGGFFTIYKKGQGYWTRLGTACAAALLLALTAQFLYTQLPVLVPWLQENRNWNLGIAAVFCAGAALLLWWLMNKPDNADFLIATDSEMKKVNWTSRRELVGSTKVVIFFMFVIATSLFIIDVAFGYIFWFLTVLKSKPF